MVDCSSSITASTATGCFGFARAHGIHHRALSYDVTTPGGAASDVRGALREDRALSHVVVVHHETTTGLLNPVAEIARRRGPRRAGGPDRRDDSLFGEPLDVTQDGIDFADGQRQQVPAGRARHLVRCSAGGARSTPSRRAPAQRVPRPLQHYVTQEAGQHAVHPGGSRSSTRCARRCWSSRRKPSSSASRANAENARVLRRGMAALGFEILVARARARASSRPSGCCRRRLRPVARRDERRGYIIYAGQGDIGSPPSGCRTWARPHATDMQGVVRRSPKRWPSCAPRRAMSGRLAGKVDTHHGAGMAWGARPRCSSRKRAAGDRG